MTVELLLFGSLLVWVPLAGVASTFATNKGRSGVAFFFLSLFFSPVVGILAAVAAKPDMAAIEQWAILNAQQKECPACAELVRWKARVCRYCGQDFPRAAEQ